MWVSTYNGNLVLFQFTLKEKLESLLSPLWHDEMSFYNIPLTQIRLRTPRYLIDVVENLFENTKCKSTHEKA